MTETHFESTYREQPPDGSTVAAAGWDIGEPQPVVVELERAGSVRGRVLDAGCGTGENALLLAELGYPVTGIDSAPSAIEHAGAKADRRGARADFAVADALELPGYRGCFDTVVDSGLFHVFSDTEREHYLAALHRACRPDALVHVLAFSEQEPGGWGPRRVSGRELRDAFTDGWVLQTLRPSAMVGEFPGEGRREIRAWLATARRR